MHPQASRSLGSLIKWWDWETAPHGNRCYWSLPVSNLVLMDGLWALLHTLHMPMLTQSLLKVSGEAYADHQRRWWWVVALGIPPQTVKWELIMFKYKVIIREILKQHENNNSCQEEQSCILLPICITCRNNPSNNDGKHTEMSSIKYSGLAEDCWGQWEFIKGQKCIIQLASTITEPKIWNISCLSTQVCLCTLLGKRRL